MKRKKAREAATEAVKEQVIAVYEERYAEDENYETIMRDVAEILEQMEHAEVRRLITEDKNFVLMVVVLMKISSIGC